jgi:hypothetical protein
LLNFQALIMRRMYARVWDCMKIKYRQLMLVTCLSWVWCIPTSANVDTWLEVHWKGKLVKSLWWWNMEKPCIRQYSRLATLCKILDVKLFYGASLGYPNHSTQLAICIFL